MKSWYTCPMHPVYRIFLIALLWASPVLGFDTPEQIDPAVLLLQEGRDAFKIGNFEKAVETFTQAARLYAQRGDLNQGTQALLRLAETLQLQSKHKEALTQIALANRLAKKMFEKGDYEQAADNWVQIARLSKRDPEPDLELHLKVLLSLGEALQYQGRYRFAVAVLEEAIVVITKIDGQIDNRTYTAITLGRLGNAYAALEEVQPALGYLIVGQYMVEPKNSSLKAALFNDRGNVLAVQAARYYQESKALTDQRLDKEAGKSLRQAKKYNDAAINAYADAVREAAKEPKNKRLVISAVLNFAKTYLINGNYKEAKDQTDQALKLVQQSVPSQRLEITAVLNFAKAYLINGDYKEAKDQTEQALNLVQDLPPSDHQANGLINVALLYQDLQNLQKGLPDSQESLFNSAENSLKNAALITEKLGSARTKSYAWGQLGSLYEKKGRVGEALKQTRKALSALSGRLIKTTPSHYKWEWQLGRLLRKNGENLEAHLAYKRAVDALKNTPRSLPRGYPMRKVSFRDGPGQLYLELSDFYLTEQSLAKEEDKSPIELARNVMEDFKIAEIQDYYQDNCVEAYEDKLKTIDQVSQGRNLAVIYPILFPDRLEILATISGNIYRAPSQKIPEEKIRKTVYAFRKSLQELEGLDYEEITDIAVKGEEAYPDLLRHGNTLYNWLIKPWEEKLAPDDTVIFVPDGALRTIPIAALYDKKTKSYLIQKHPIATASGFNLPDPKGMDREKMKVLYMGLSTKVEGFPALSGAKDELETLERLYGEENRVKSFLNKDFIIKDVSKEMEDEGYTIVHVATHAVFANDINKSFILASEDTKIAINDLRQMIGVFKFRDRPLDLLTLSACQTAVGDEQAALGLASIAINAGARSALATLWSVRDRPSSKLIDLFYEEINNPNVSKAKALQLAQIKMLDKPHWKHPFFWSGFLLLNNWL